MIALPGQSVGSEKSRVFSDVIGATSQLTTLIAAAYSLSGVWLITAGLTLTAAAPALFATATNGQVSLALPERRGVYGLVLLACVVGWYASFPLARLLGRLVPVKANGKPRYGFIVACLAFAALWLIASAFTIRDTFIFLVPITALVLASLTWTLNWHIRTTRSVEAPFVLFLRRFSTFSDRSVLAALQASRPQAFRTVFLTSPFEKPGNFSPVVLAFSGTSLAHPFKSCPLPLRARHVEWEDNIEDLARAASCVVIDPSNFSPAIDREIEIVRSAVGPERIVWLRETAGADQDALESSGQTSRAGERTIRYSRSWRSAVPRILLETLAIAIVALVVAASVAQSVPLPQWVPWLLGLGLVALGAPVILRPNVDPHARAALGKALSMSTERMLPSRIDAQRREQCAIVCSQTHVRAEHEAFLCQVADDAGLQPVVVRALTGGRTLRDAIRLIANAAVVIVDTSAPDRDVEYLLGVAHGLGQKVILVSRDHANASSRGDACVFTPGATSRAELTRLVIDHRADPLRRGPVAGLLADERVFGTRLLWRRVVALSVDVFLSIASVAGYQLWTDSPGSGSDFWVYTFWAVVVVFGTLRFVSLAFFGTTPGMGLVGLRLIDADGGPLRLGQAAGRSAAILVTFVPFAGFLFALFGPRYQALEDLLSETVVTRR